MTLRYDADAFAGAVPDMAVAATCSVAPAMEA